MPRVLIVPEALRDQAGAYRSVLEDAGFEVAYPRHATMARGNLTPAEMLEELTSYEACVASSEPYTHDLLSQLPQLRVIARCGVGYDCVDVEAATEFGKAVTITPTANHEAVAELALALLFSVSKSLQTNRRAIQTGEWPRELLRPLRTQTLGILGMGRIGRSLAVRALALGMRVLACDEKPPREFLAEHGIQLVGWQELLQQSDCLSLHCPFTETTAGVMNREAFQQMRSGAILINTARGGLVEEPALIEALQSGQLAGAGLDVFAQEPPDRDNPLLSMENVAISPHLGGCDQLSMAAMAEEAARCIVQLHQNRWPDGAVINPSLRSSWRWT